MSWRLTQTRYNSPPVDTSCGKPLVRRLASAPLHLGEQESPLLVQIIDFDQSNSGSAILPENNGGITSRRQRGGKS